MATDDQDPLTKKQTMKNFSITKAKRPAVNDEDVEQVMPKKARSGDLESGDEALPKKPVVIDEATREAQKAVTENMSPAFTTSGDPSVDFFFHTMEKTEDKMTLHLLEESWSKDPLVTLKLIGHLHDKQAKGIRHQFHVCLWWLYQHHPRTLYENMDKFVGYGYWKDLLHLVIIICFNGFIPPYMKNDDCPSDKKNKKRGRRRRAAAGEVAEKRTNAFYNKAVAEHYNQTLDTVNRKEMEEMRMKFARERYDTDSKYRLFHVRVAQLFAKQLISDVSDVKNKKNVESLAGKWAPTVNQHFDKYTLIATSIALELVNLVDDKEIASKQIAIATYLARKLYHKEYCVPLRKYHKVPERFMCSNSWGQIDYNRVPAKCMKKNKALFIAHDKERFEKFVASKEKIAGATLKPVEIVKQILDLEDDKADAEIERSVCQKQWNSLAESIKKKGGGLLKNAIAVCDVSGSMEGTPMMAALALTLLTMELTDEPWNTVCITFDEEPSLHSLDTSMNLLEKLRSMKSMPWGGSTNFNKVFEVIVSCGRKYNLQQEQMPKVLFVFTDMEFNEAFSGTTKTNYEAAQEMMEKAGYKLPPIVFWNLRPSQSTPVQVDENGTILLSGYSGQQLAFIAQEEDLTKVNPLSFMMKSVDQPQYKDLQVYD